MTRSLFTLNEPTLDRSGAVRKNEAAKTKLVLLFFCSALAIGCTGESGAGNDRATVTITRLDTPSSTQTHCIVFPILLGSRIDDSFALEDSNAWVVSEATRDGLLLKSKGDVDAGSQYWTLADIEGGSYETWSLDTDDGSSFELAVSSGCL